MSLVAQARAGHLHWLIINLSRPLSLQPYIVSQPLNMPWKAPSIRCLDDTWKCCSYQKALTPCHTDSATVANTPHFGLSVLSVLLSVLRAWHLAAGAAGAQLGVFMAFSHIGGNSKYGSWGALEVRPCLGVMACRELPVSRQACSGAPNAIWLGIRE